MNDSEYKPITVANWIFTFVILSVPLVNVLMLIIWAVGGTAHPSKKAFAQAFFVMLGISVCIGALVGLLWPVFVHHKGDYSRYI